MTPSGLSRSNSSASDGYSGTPNFSATSWRRRARVDDRRRAPPTAGVDLLDVPLADQAGAGDRDPR